MKKLALAFLLIASAAGAQQPSEDGRLAVYRQLLTRSQDELAMMGGQLQAAQMESAQLKAELAKLKADADKKP